MKEKIKKKGALNPVFKNNNLVFQWARIDKDKYLIVIRKIFKKEPSDSFAIISEKKFNSFSRLYK